MAGFCGSRTKSFERFALLTSLALSLLWAGGCGGARRVLRADHTPSYLTLATDGMSMTLPMGTVVAGTRVEGVPRVAVQCTDVDGLDEMQPAVVVHGYERARRWGAVPATVSFADGTTRHGLFLICRQWDTAYGPAARSLRVIVPSQYVEESSAGRVSVVYEQVRARDPSGAWYAWVLWLSDDDVF